MVTLHQIESGELGDPEIIKEVVCRLKGEADLFLKIEELEEHYPNHKRECGSGWFVYMFLPHIGSRLVSTLETKGNDAILKYKEI